MATARPKPFGPFFDKAHLARLQSRASVSLANKAPAIKAALVASTPVGEARRSGRPGGTLRASVTTRVSKSKRGVTITARADAQNEQGVHYGVFVEAVTGFLTNALADAAISHIEDAIVDFVNEQNGALSPTAPVR